VKWFGLMSDDIDQFEEPFPPDLWGSADWSEADTSVEMAVGRGATSGVERSSGTAARL
jgi:hypothetical protein